MVRVFLFWQWQKKASLSKRNNEQDEIRESKSLHPGPLFDVQLLDLANKDTECQVTLKF